MNVPESALARLEQVVSGRVLLAGAFPLARDDTPADQLKTV